MAAIFGERKLFLELPRVLCSDILWVENFDKITPSGTLKEIEANLCGWPPKMVGNSLRKVDS